MNHNTEHGIELRKLYDAERAERMRRWGRRALVVTIITAVIILTYLKGWFWRNGADPTGSRQNCYARNFSCESSMQMVFFSTRLLNRDK